MIIDRLAKAYSFLKSDAKSEPRSDALAAISSPWQNAWTGLGSSGTDRVTAHVPGYLSVLTTDELEVLALGDGLSRKIISKVVSEAFKNGIIIAYSGNEERSKDMTGDVTARCEELGLAAKAQMAAELGRAYGMGGLMLGVAGESDIAELPLVDESIRELDYLTVIDRRDLSVERWRKPTEASHFPEHEYYIPCGDRQIYDMDLARLHASYIVGFGGTPTPIRDRRRYFSGFDAPVLQLVWDVLRRFDAANQSVDAMLQDGSQGVMMIRDLWKVVTQKGGLDKLETRMEASALYRAAHKILVIDAGGADGAPPEDFKWVQRTFAGLADLTQDKQALVAAVADMPITKLFGRSPAGENATGEHDELNWQSSVASWFRSSAQPQISRIVQIVARTLGASDPERFSATIPALQQMSAQQQAELEEMVAKTDDIRIQQGFPEDVILRHRYGQGEFRADPPILSEEDLLALEQGPSLSSLEE